MKKLFSFANRFDWITRNRQAHHEDLTPGAQLGHASSTLNEHIIVCGYGPTGSYFAKQMQEQGYNTVIVDLNYRSIQALKDLKQNAIYGDSASTVVLEAAGVARAILLAVTIPDPIAMQALVRKVKKLRPDLPIIMRVKYMSDRDKLLTLGATEIVWEEQESGKVLVKKAREILSENPS